MKAFVLTPRTELDLTEIWEYIAEDDIEAADRVLAQLETAMRKLAQMPGMGHVREDLADRRHRFWPVHSYLIVYRKDTKPLQIIRVISGCRDMHGILA